MVRLNSKTLWLLLLVVASLMNEVADCLVFGYPCYDSVLSLSALTLLLLSEVNQAGHMPNDVTYGA